jgi:hypothetical protein
MNQNQQAAPRKRRYGKDEFAAFTTKKLIRAFELNIDTGCFRDRETLVCLFRLWGIDPAQVARSTETGKHRHLSGLNIQYIEGIAKYEPRIVTT